MSTLNVGFIGLGIMGAPMCGHLINAGHNVFVTTRSKVPEAIAEQSHPVRLTTRSRPESGPHHHDASRYA